MSWLGSVVIDGARLKRNRLQVRLRGSTRPMLSLDRRYRSWRVRRGFRDHERSGGGGVSPAALVMELRPLAEIMSRH